MTDKLLSVEIEILLCEFLHPATGIAARLDRIGNLLEKQVSQINELNSAIDALGTQLSAVSQEITTALNDLMARNTNQDLSGPIAKLAGLNAVVAQIGKLALSDDPSVITTIPPITAATVLPPTTVITPTPSNPIGTATSFVTNPDGSQLPSTALPTFPDSMSVVNSDATFPAMTSTATVSNQNAPLPSTAN